MAILLVPGSALSAEQAGSIRGTVYDKDFDAPLAAVTVAIAETGQSTVTADEGNFLFSEVEPGDYTLIFSKEGYARQVKADVVVSPGKMTEVDASLSGEFMEMEEFVVQEVLIGTGTEAALLDLRMESPALIDSISADLMSRAGAGDAAGALKLVAGATVAEGKYAVVRGLPDRYVNSQMNGVRLPTADADKRAVQLDQFPSAAIESIQVSKTFTPDQQGDASGGAVNVVLKGVPNEAILKLESGISYNTQVRKAGNKFLSYKGGGANFWGKEDRDIPADPGIFKSAGVSGGDAPTDYKWSLAGGRKFDFDDFKIGGFGSFFYERDSSFFNGGIDNYMFRKGAGFRREPVLKTVNDLTLTSLYDAIQASEQLQWGGLGVVGIETENHSLTASYMNTRNTEDKAILLEDTRGKKHFFPQYDPDNPDDYGNSSDGRGLAPYQRSETIEYTERKTQTLQFTGRHTLPGPDLGIKNIFTLLSPQIDWTIAKSSAGLYQPDKRLFGSYWVAEGDGYNEGHWENKGPNINLGNFHRIWKDISEDSDQYSVNFKIPFEQWSGDDGYLKFGLFNDKLVRQYKQESFSNTDGDVDSWENHGWREFWSGAFPYEGHAMLPSEFDVDYEGRQDISAWYYMADLPLCSFFNVIGGFRHEKTELNIMNDPDRNPATGLPTAVWYLPETGIGPMEFNPADTDVSFKQNDVLPSIGFEFRPSKKVTLRGSYTETVARQTFKELSPILQQEFLGGDVFIGNPGLKMSALKNYDLRADYTPYDGGLLSFSYFYKDVKDPIEYVQGNAGFTYTYPTNYPKGKLSGFEAEIRQQMSYLWDRLKGFSVGANATFINSEVTLPKSEAQYLRAAGAPSPTRDMTNTPEYLYNIFLTYDLPETGTQLGLFYTVQGDTLLTGAGASGVRYTPDVYAKHYGTLNLSLSQKLGEIWDLKLQVKNLLNPDIETVYRSKYIGDDVTKTSYKKGIEFSISLSARF